MNLKRSQIIVLGAILGLIAICHPALAQDSVALSDKLVTNRDLAKVVVTYYLENQKILAAEQYLEQHLATDHSDPYALRTLGNIQMQFSNYEKAEGLFARAAAVTFGTERGKNLYLMADAQTRAGKVDAAEKSLDMLTELPGFQKAVDDSKGLVNSRNPLPNLVIEDGSSFSGERAFNLRGSIIFGYDNNVLLVRYPEQTETRGIHPASEFIKPVVQAQYATTVDGRSLSFQGYAAYTDHRSSDATQFNNISSVVGVEHALGGSFNEKHQIAIGDNIDLTWLNSNGMDLYSYGNALFIRGNLKKHEEKSLDFYIPFAYRLFPGAKPTNSSDAQQGLALDPSLSYRHRVGRLAITHSVTFNYAFSAGKNYRYAGGSASIQAMREILLNTSLSATGSYKATDYYESLTDRQDDRLGIDLQLTKRKLTNRIPVELKLGYGFESARSNQITGTYNKHTILVGLTYDAF